MNDFTVKLAGVPVRVHSVFPETSGFLGRYLSDEEPELSIVVEEEDIRRERALNAAGRREEGESPYPYGERFLETQAICRKLAEALTVKDVLLFHGSAIAVDGEAYLFTARSGTGKSTHSRLWREAFGDRAVMVNDDKPLLRIREDGVRVYGTPWNGKHRLGDNISAPLKAICILTRAEENRIVPVTAEEAFPVLYQQCYRPAEPEALLRTLDLLEELSKRVRLYRLGCNMDPAAALVSYKGMQEETK